MKSIINQRFIDAVNFIIEENIKENKTSIGKNLRIKPAKFSEILNCRMNVGIDEIVYFSEHYNFSLDWLLTGQGEMLRTGAIGSSNPELQIENERLKEENSELKSKLLACQEEIIVLLRGSKSKAS